MQAIENSHLNTFRLNQILFGNTPHTRTYLESVKFIEIHTNRDTHIQIYKKRFILNEKID